MEVRSCYSVDEAGRGTSEVVEADEPWRIKSAPKTCEPLSLAVKSGPKHPPQALGGPASDVVFGCASERSRRASRAFFAKKRNAH